MLNRIWIKCLFSFYLLFVTTAVFAADLPTLEQVKNQLTQAQSTGQDEPTQKQLIQNLQDTVALLERLEAQKQQNGEFEQTLQESGTAIHNLQTELQQLKVKQGENVQSADDFSQLSLEQLQAKLDSAFQQVQTIQNALSEISAKIINQQTLPDRTQALLTTNLTRTQTLNRLLLSSQVSHSLADKYQVELALIEAQNNYNKALLQNSDTLMTWYELQKEQQNIYLKQNNEQIAHLQTLINQKRLALSQEKLAQLEQSQKNNAQQINPFIQNELNKNTEYSQLLLQQTEQFNQLTQENLRIKNVLDNLIQTQRTIDEQISALQGTLVLSRIINQQKQRLPSAQEVKGLSKSISDLRVQIFDLTQTRDEIYQIDSYIDKLMTQNSIKQPLSAEDRTLLVSTLTDRRKILSEIIKGLNNQLNLSITMELNQKQVTTISDELQKKLQQQSFWVKSNNPINWEWLKKFPELAVLQLKEIGKHFEFSSADEDIFSTVLFTLFLLAVIGLVFWQKEKIKGKLSSINAEVGTLNADSQLHTPIALLLTSILALPAPLIFLILVVLVSHFSVQDPMVVWSWAVEMAGYWWFFAFTLALLRPNGLAYRHFDQPKETNLLFQSILKRSMWIVMLLVNASVLGSVENTGAVNDVLGEVVTISSLIFCVMIIAPRFGKAVKKYQNIQESLEQDDGGFALKLFRILFILVPIVLVVLVGLGYYYTALNLIEHLILTYVVTVTWVVIKQVLKRGLTVSARRLAYKRLKEKREKIQAEINADNQTKDNVVEQKEQSLAINQVKEQVNQVLDLSLWAVLFGLYYWVWSDLLTVAYYLQGITLWQQTVTTADGATTTEAITLFNLFLAIVILAVMYALLRNIGGLLEVLIFARVKLSQGAPYTITTLLSYFIVAIGAAWAFSTLGMSWSKLQWLFAALSVGLGFGLQEIFANFVSGLIILFERPIRIGDMITIGEFTGTVTKIRIRATTIVDPDGKEVIVPNKAFVTERLTNWALSNTMTRIVIQVGVAYGSNLELTRQLLLQAADECETALKDPAPRALFLTFGASTLDHELRVYVGQLSDRLVTTDFLNRRIDELFKQHNIEIAFNQLDVYIKNLSNQQEVQVESIKQVTSN